MPPTETVITGIGVLSPIGIGKQLVWAAYCAGRNGVGPIRLFDPGGLPIQIAGEVQDFDPKMFVKPRKNLKVMLRDAKLGVAASVLACDDAGLADSSVDPDRFGVVLGADRICGDLYDSEAAYRRCIIDGRFDMHRWAPDGFPEVFPLTFLRVLPNMIASHVSIVQDARGPNNTIHQAEVSSLLAMREAVRVIQRGAADIMMAGGASSMTNPFDWACHCVVKDLSTRQDDPAEVMRPFDADRDGEVCAEGAGIFVIESKAHAEARGATVLARILGCSSACEPCKRGNMTGDGLRRAIELALDEARLGPGDLGHVNAHGVSTVTEDAIEAKAIQATVGDVPVTAPKSYFGNMGAAGGAVEMIASVMSFAEGLVPATRNYERPDPECPIVVVNHEPRETSKRTALVLNFTTAGQATAMVLAEP